MKLTFEGRAIEVEPVYDGKAIYLARLRERSPVRAASCVLISALSGKRKVGGKLIDVKDCVPFREALLSEGSNLEDLLIEVGIKDAPKPKKSKATKAKAAEPKAKKAE